MKYETPEIDIIEFQREDVITASVVEEGPGGIIGGNDWTE